MLERRAMDDRINKIAEDVAYMRAKIEDMPKMRQDINELKEKTDRGMGFIAGVAALGGIVGSFVTKLFHLG